METTSVEIQVVEVTFPLLIVEQTDVGIVVTPPPMVVTLSEKDVVTTSDVTCPNWVAVGEEVQDMLSPARK